MLKPAFMKRNSPWLLAGLITLVGATQAYLILQAAAAPANWIEQFVFVLSVAVIAFVGALIVVRQSGNRIGRLLLVIALVTALPIFYDPVVASNYLSETPPDLSPGIWLLLWLQGWFWLLQMVAIFQVVLRFPTGELLSQRWNWTGRTSVITIVFAVFVAAFPARIGPINGAWKVDNPVGFLIRPAADGLSLVWVIGLLVLAFGSLSSIVVRFKGGNDTTRQQIKWLLFAGALIALIAVFTPFYFSVNNTSPIWLNIFVQAALMLLPLAISNAILRYRLYEIDIFIRRTLSYSILTAALGSLYFGGVLLLQGLSGRLAGSTDNPIVTVVTTLTIAALFNPLRVRIQDVIDRRFFRRKYDAENALNAFAAVARDQVDISRLSRSLLTMVETTMQPEKASLWLRETPHER